MKFYSIALIVIATSTIATITIVCNVVMTTAIDDDDELFSKSSRQCYVSFIPYLSKTLNFTTAQNIFIREMCRFTKKEMFQILSHLDLQSIRFRARYATNSKVALTMLCARLSYLDRLKSLMHNFDHSKTWLSVIFNDIVLHLTRKYEKMLWWFKRLIYDLIMKFAMTLYESEKSHCFWDFIDDIDRFICKFMNRDMNEQREFYSEHKHFHCFNNQTIVTFDDIVINLMNLFVNRRNDLDMFIETKIEKYLRTLNVDKKHHERLWIYENSIYQNCWNTIKITRTYIDYSITAKKRNFNRHMTQWRIEIKHAFDIHINSWQLFTKKSVMKMKTSFVIVYYQISMLMINIMCCLRNNQTTKRFDVASSELNKYLIEFEIFEMKIEIHELIEFETLERETETKIWMFVNRCAIHTYDFLQYIHTISSILHDFECILCETFQQLKHFCILHF